MGQLLDNIRNAEEEVVILEEAVEKNDWAEVYTCLFQTSLNSLEIRNMMSKKAQDKYAELCGRIVEKINRAEKKCPDCLKDEILQLFE